ncbi:MAG: EamA family transporter [Desulfovibrio sp.]|nr:EamA family transporter [Desulfovibrio sp.]
MALRAAILFHLFLVYISWGTTYIGFHLTLEVVGPFFACGFRMALGGLLLIVLLRLFGSWKPFSLRDLGHAAFFGLFLVVCASGFLSYGQQYVATSVASLVFGATPLMMLVAGWLVFGDAKPRPLQWIGLLLGTASLALLSLEKEESASTSLVGIAWILCASLGWVVGSLLLRKHPRATLPPLEDCGLLLLMGGLECLGIGLVLGEQYAIHTENIRPSIVIAFGWMVIGGAILAYSSYFWLLRHVALAVAVSYEYVVPVIGIFLGWFLLDETVSVRMLVCAAMAVGSVFLIVIHKHRN